MEPKPFVRNAADRHQTEDADGRSKRGRERELEDIRFLLGTPQGKRVFWRYLGMTRLFETSFELSAKIHYNEGVRSVGLKILGDITEAEPMSFVEMMRAAGEEAKKLS